MFLYSVDYKFTMLLMSVIFTHVDFANHVSNVSHSSHASYVYS